MTTAEVAQPAPSARYWTYWVARAYLKVFGWELEGQLPNDRKAVLIAAPHTTGWDLPHMLAVAWANHLDLCWLGKHTLFEGWAGSFMRWLGGIPVDRRSKNGAVAQAVDHIKAADMITLAIAPAGTRSEAKHWKSGFYHIANTAKIPILCGFLDFKRKVGGVGPAIMPTGNITKDMDRIRAFYADIEGMYPEKKTEIRLKEEDQSRPASALHNSMA
jgi:1-acyl-sn-glycerol-3-phosphate acyltransferase